MREPVRPSATHGVRAGVVALSGVTAAIVGGRNTKQVDGVMSAANFRLFEEEFAEIQGYVKEHVS
ncbi:MAG: hypothetical protein PW789_03050 [Edaphobacter sp.]|uniref:hypothetical protein n=1 Tax=Edaphobacter sp. TaxID=1934404 RepID=UPI0023850D6B|nr:hypothetical protein [Edaphobacter sp.]MDE1175562.1 hypothetical protein [Edaphobacter sp.]